MTGPDYKKLFEREQKAKLQAEQLLEEKARDLYLRNLQVDQQQAALIHSEKMASIGGLAAGIAHEINNPLGFCSSNLRTLQRYIATLTPVLNLKLNPNLTFDAYKENLLSIDAEGLLKDATDLLHENLEGLEKIKKIVDGLKTFSHASTENMTPYNVNDCLKTSLAILRPELKTHNCQIKESLSDLPLLNCFPDKLSQVFINLIHNASHAVTENGLIQIKTKQKNNQIIVKISDNGSGIAPENLTKIFNPFFTTKPIGVGTGLGLSISYNIIKNHQGSIKVMSTPNQGTTFTVKLPLNAPTLKP